MPTLLQINVTANWGSTGKIAESIGLGAIAHDWESCIAYGRYANLSRSELIRIGSSIDTYWHYGVQRIVDNEGLCSKKATRALVKKIKKIAPDVIQLHNIHDHYLNYQILFEYLNNTDIKVVWTFHDCWAFTGHCMHFVTKNCERWKSGCHHCPQKGEYPRTLLDRSAQNYDLKRSLFSANKNLNIVACSDWIAEFVRESFLKEKKIQVIHNGVDLIVFKPISANKDNNDNNDIFKILAVSNVWTKEKGLFDIYNLRELLPKDIEIVLVGVSAKQQKNLPDGVIGIQRTQNVGELVQLYNEANILINPTYADTFPTVNLEALACGTPVITYNTGGSPEAIDENTGIVVPQGDVTTLALAILKLKQEPLSSEACRKRAELYFDKDKCFKQYINLYNELISSQ